MACLGVGAFGSNDRVAPSEVPTPTLLERLQLARLGTAHASEFLLLQRQASDRGCKPESRSIHA